ncbi:sulfate ABC transporter ATP-binding protein [Leptolyngbya sp. 'hensonii']|uniref:sulfate/molybdate ABC transporter ATP-binding protein n=1 Tax=Leptolyngbya sp. 'hensonii' TaxID=1922337 RepID=UPI00095032C6|nr:sulfate/molybdate ABC transporter ATP-binding protein [Leptolyngbya sp. 'hensonii']OLP17061.1 sulfate ABC transporter ATP-binding protein [Leptolyngbya sp. 'hensonii']
MAIRIDNVSKAFGSFMALGQVSVDIEDGKLVALLGPSGSGKSTLLRVIAGLEHPDSGQILLEGQDVTRAGVQDRGIGFVFQHYALFKHLTVRQNIAFGLEISKWPQSKVQKRVTELLDLIQLAGLGDRYPSQLSGGQRQRVALARALALQPKVLLLDEPFGALDAKVRKELRAWLRRLHNEVHVTTVFVTHDQEEAMEVADTLVVMNQGRIEQVGTPVEIYDRPASSFVMSFIGPVNVLSNRAPLFRHNHAQLLHPKVFLRPHDLVIELQPIEGGAQATVYRVIYLGWETQVELILEDGEVITVHLPREVLKELDLQPRQQVYVKPKDAKVFTFPELAAQAI